MGTHTADTEVVRVSQKGQLTVPQSLREKFDIETPGEVFVYDDGGRIVIRSVPSLEELHGIHADTDESTIARERETATADDRRETEKLAALIDRHDGSSEP
jgi:AbrB family looped-hinge helix DNA binding protein